MFPCVNSISSSSGVPGLPGKSGPTEGHLHILMEELSQSLRVCVVDKDGSVDTYVLEGIQASHHYHHITTTISTSNPNRMGVCFFLAMVNSAFFIVYSLWRFHETMHAQQIHLISDTDSHLGACGDLPRSPSLGYFAHTPTLLIPFLNWVLTFYSILQKYLQHRLCILVVEIWLKI